MPFPEIAKLLRKNQSCEWGYSFFPSFRLLHTCSRTIGGRSFYVPVPITAKDVLKTKMDNKLAV